MRRIKNVTWQKCAGCGQEFRSQSRRHVFCSARCQDGHFNGRRDHVTGAGEIIEAQPSAAHNYAIGDRVWVESERAHAVVVKVGVDSYTVILETFNVPVIEVAASELARGIPF